MNFKKLGSVNSKRAHRTRAFVTLLVPVKGICQKISAPGVGHLSILLEAVKVVPFSIFYYYKNTLIYLDSCIKNIFNAYAFK